jgi:hypothetical protein
MAHLKADLQLVIFSYSVLVEGRLGLVQVA